MRMRELINLIEQHAAIDEITRKDVMDFVCGGCGALALALHRRTGRPMLARMTTDHLGREGADHIVLQWDDGLVLDVRGVHREDGLRPCTTTDISRWAQQRSIGSWRQYGARATVIADILLATAEQRGATTWVTPATPSYDPVWKLNEELTPGVTAIARRRNLRPSDEAVRSAQAIVNGDPALRYGAILDLKATTPTEMEITYIEVLTRGQRMGSRLMDIVTQEADRNGVGIRLKAVAQRTGMPQDALVNFYQKRGFDVIDPEEVILYRPPH